MTDATPGQIAMARRIAAHALCGPEKWKPGVKAGICEEIMRGEVDAEALVQGPLAAIIETQRICAEVADEMRTMHSSPTGDAYTCGMWDQGVRIAHKIREGQQFGKDEG